MVILRKAVMPSAAIIVLAPILAAVANHLDIDPRSNTA